MKNLICFLAIVVIAFAITILIFNSSEEEIIDTRVLSCEISNTDYSTAWSRATSYVSYIIAVRNEGFSATIKVDADTWARYAVGDTVDVKITTWQWREDTWEEYEILGLTS